MNRNQEQEETTLSEHIRLNYLARKLEELSSPREITIASIRYQEEVIALKEKLNAIQAIINSTQTQERK